VEGVVGLMADLTGWRHPMLFSGPLGPPPLRGGYDDLDEARGRGGRRDDGSDRVRRDAL